MWYKAKPAILRNSKNRETQECYNDRVKISHKHDAKHFEYIECANDKLSVLTYLEYFKDKYNDSQILGNYQLYVRYISSLRFASPITAERIVKKPCIQTIKCIEKQIKNEIGHALQSIIPQHIPLYCALLYRLLTFADFKPDTYQFNKYFSKHNFFQQQIHWADGKTETILLPGLCAPHSACNFLIRWCDLEKELHGWDSGGYDQNDIKHQLSEIAGLLAFYTQERYNIINFEFDISYFDFNYISY